MNPHYQVKLSSQSGAVLNFPFWIIYINFGDSLTFHLPSLGQNLDVLPQILVYVLQN